MAPPTSSPVSTDERVNYWKQKLSSVTEFQLPLDYPRPHPSRYVDATLQYRLPESASLAVLQLSMRHPGTNPASPFLILLSAFSILLHKYTGEEDIVVGSSSTSSNPLVLRLPVVGSQTFGEVLKVVQSVEEEAANHEIPFQTLFEALYPSDLQQNVTPPPLFRVRFFNQTDASEDTLNQTTAVNDLTVLIGSRSSGSLRSMVPEIEVTVSYNQVLFSSSRIAHILDQLSLVLEQGFSSPELAISHFSLVTPRCLQTIPDPKAPLGWEDWKGAIPDIFTRNAHQFPERVCLVETQLANRQELTGATGATFTRQFSYHQINRASNLVAHYLIDNGVEREDVVTMYAYRGVDLAVGVMGILKAGCTFNVIDPAYPPARQEIYLSVAKPRAIIVLKRAGELLPSVREYIDSNLQVKCELTGLELQSDGTLSYGGNSNSNSKFDPTHQDNDANVELGPDSIATLSFTSGSTGIPKGVRGRHFSLTHFYPWMGETFGINEDDKFTMLSGIAHDPIQRDIFTPFFFGAQLHIPDPEIIGIPGRLAGWMAESGVTVTHLTPAMGQLLSANAETSIPSLRNAFFVGDILTKRDCLRLQHLAPNTCIINMYGTTETQRAVSFYRVPSLSSQPSFLTSAKDVLPAGQGMHNVQLLVVSRIPDANGLRSMCGVGEVGEIYVRSGGLSEGYLGLPDATNEKFLANWFSGPPLASKTLPFFKGPRDRMYRSGDLGRYLPDGIVECIGRADDQVKIRGFRIELGEIDTHLSQHPRVRENVTLVRRDQNEEQTLVAYFVPNDPSNDDTSCDENDFSDLASPRRYRRLIKDIREWLKQKLPSYSVPSVIVPLIKMPLNPNGKIDKPALPFPDTARQVSTTVSSDQMSSTERMVLNIWTQVLNVPSVDLSDNFFDIGGHSILATRLIFQLRKDSCVDVPLGLVFQCPTIQTMAKAVDDLRSLDLNIAGLNDANDPVPIPEVETEYAKDLDLLLQNVPWGSWNKARDCQDIQPRPFGSSPTFFLTGATGFLGAFILGHLIGRHPDCKVFCLARAPDDFSAFQRVKDNCVGRLLWKSEWESRVVGIHGDLASPNLGLSTSVWDSLVREVDVIVHNGAQVHWVYPYAKLRNANVLGTLEVLKLAAQPAGAKPVHFVSSTSVLDTEHYVKLSDQLANEATPYQGVPEHDNLEGSRSGLTAGYGQSKWVAEKLVMSAGAAGIPVTILRPGYVVGDSNSGVTLSDDFLWRLVKGCIQLEHVPRMDNVVNMCPVDYVAQAVVEAASTTTPHPKVYQIANPHRFKFTHFFQAVRDYGYKVEWSDYVTWRNQLMDVTLKAGDNALYPLLHFVLDDLPTSTKAPELDASHTRELLSPLGIECPDIGSLMGKYLAYLIHVDFLPSPDQNDPRFQLPKLDLPVISQLTRSNRI